MRVTRWLCLAAMLAGCAEATDGAGAAPDGATRGDAASDAFAGAADCGCDAAPDARPSPAPDGATADPDGAAADPDGATADGATAAPDGATAAPDGATADPDGAVAPLVVAGGDVSGRWCGEVLLQARAIVPEGQTLDVCAGTVVRASGGRGTSLDVAGTLRVLGEPGRVVRFEGADGWRGLRVGGVLEAQHVVIAGAAQCLDGARGSSIRMDHARFEACQQQSFVLASGGTFTHTEVIGTPVTVSGGLLSMTDSLIDLQHPTRSPDCAIWNGGGAELVHVRFTGCHCPLHINQAPDGVHATDSVFDGATYPVMIANTRATFRRCHFDGTSDDFLDVGGNFTADIADNWFGGDAPRLAGAASAFSGGDQWSRQPFDGAGPRD